MAAAPETRENENVVETYVREYFAPRNVHPDHLPDVMFKHIYTGAMGSIWGTLIAGLFLVYFGNRVGLTPFEWGVTACIGSWVLLTELFSAAITQRLGHRKLLWFCCVLADRSLRFIGIVTAFLLWRHGWTHAGVVLVLALSLATCLGAMAGPPWLSWLADIIPEKEHGEFWGRRSAWVALATVAVSVPAALFMDWAPEEHKLNATLVVFGAATAIGLVDLVIHGTIPEPRMAKPPKGDFLRQLKEPLRDRGFRPFLIFSFCWTFSLMLGATLITVYLMEDLGCKHRFAGTMLATSVAYLVGCVVSAKWTGSLIDRHGPKKVMRIGYLMWATIPFWWLLLTPGNVLWIIGALNVIAAFFVTAGANAYLKIQTRYPPAPHRAMYIAVSNSASYIATGLAALTAGFLVRWLDGWSCVGPLGWNVNRYDVLSMASLLLRVGSVLLLIGSIRESSAPASSMARPAGAHRHDTMGTTLE